MLIHIHMNIHIYSYRIYTPVILNQLAKSIWKEISGKIESKTLLFLKQK